MKCKITGDKLTFMSLVKCHPLMFFDKKISTMSFLRDGSGIF